MRWQTPTFEPIDMNAEIGGYQGDDDSDRSPPPAPTTAVRTPDEPSDS